MNTGSGRVVRTTYRSRMHRYDDVLAEATNYHEQPKSGRAAVDVSI